MPQVTIYLDDDTEARMRAAAQAEGIPVSRWIARLVQERTRTEWPAHVRDLAGAWPDLPASFGTRSGSPGPGESS